jgi:two-component system response regulator FlrC
MDDDAGFRSAAAQALARAGYAVDAAAGGREALALLRRKRISLVLTGAETPEAHGVQFLKTVKQTTPQVPVIVMSANGTVAGAVEALQAGASDYLLKPVPPESLEPAVRRALGTVAPAGGERRTGEPQPRLKAVVTRDPGMLAVLDMARQVAGTSATVLIQGESGTGKELLAAYIHQHSACPQAPYVAVNCAALPETLAESELFGHEKGAFTGAFTRKIGKFELARKGTLVLDEIGEMALPLQAKLLRVLQEKEIDRVGGGLPVPVDARVVAITNRDLSRSVAAGSFREDLFYRINVVPLVIPPLRERPRDIALLAEHFLKRCKAQTGKSVIGLSEPALDALERHGWKGNIRELENTMERAVILADGEFIQPRHLNLAAGGGRPAGQGPAAGLGAGTTIWEMERRLIMGTLSEVDQNRTRAAELLGISIRTLRNKLREYREGAGVPAG